MNQTLTLTSKQAREILSGLGMSPADFGYSGRKFQIEFTSKVTFWDTNWSGGTRNVYTVIRADLEKRTPAIPAPWVNTFEGQTFDLSPEFLVIEHKNFCGKDLGLTFHIHPSLAPKWLPA